MSNVDFNKKLDEITRLKARCGFRVVKEHRNHDAHCAVVSSYYINEKGVKIKLGDYRVA